MRATVEKRFFTRNSPRMMKIGVKAGHNSWFWSSAAT
jgi:hypothetical protein